MRIIAGSYRGRVLKTMRGQLLRPTSDRLRETLFDVLGAAVKDSVFIDCYAGSGAVGLEALSRGARQVYWIEQNAAAHRILLGNVAAIGEDKNEDKSEDKKAKAIRAPVQKGLRVLEQRGVRADFCFLDPPYAARQEYVRTLEWLTASRLMAPGAVIVLEHSRSETLQEQAGGWARQRLLVQGSSALSFYRSV